MRGRGGQRTRYNAVGNARRNRGERGDGVGVNREEVHDLAPALAAGPIGVGGVVRLFRLDVGGTEDFRKKLRQVRMYPKIVCKKFTMAARVIRDGRWRR